MARFHMQIAGLTGKIQCSFDSTPVYFRNYLTEAEPDFSGEVTPERRRFEQEASWAEARDEGIRPRVYTDPHLERAAVQRIFAEALFRRDTLMVHGSAVALDGMAYLFTAKCGTGKSTHTRLWREVFGPRAQMINDDKPFLQLTPSGAIAWGSPWSGKHGLDTNISAPLKGICILQRGEENRIRPLAPREVMDMLLHQSYRPLDPALHGRWAQLVETLAETTPLWLLECNKSPEAALVSFEAMSK